MSAPVKVIHPRKLHAMLVACPTPETRAAAALEFMRGCTVAEGGFLFLRRSDEQLALVASCRERDPSPGLIDEVTRVWQLKQRAPGTDQTTIAVSGSVHRLRMPEEKSVWTSPAGEVFEHRLLAVDRGGRWLPVGLAMLMVPHNGDLLPMRHVHVAAVCDALLDAGDVMVPAPPVPV